MNTLQATFRKTIHLKSATLFMKIAYQEERKDLQQYLAAAPPREKLFNGSMASLINQRVANHLKHLQLLDDAGNLTPEGEQVAASGQFEAREQGKYRIWYCLEDELLGSRILYFEREQAFDRPPNTKSKRLPFSKSEGQFCLTTQKGKRALRFSLLQTGNEHIAETTVQAGNSKGTVIFRWEWQDEANSTIRLQQGGVQQKNNGGVDFVQQALDLSIPHAPWIERFFPAWNRQQKRLAVTFEEVSETERKDFRKQEPLGKQAGFDSIHFTRVPLMPSDMTAAVKWRNWLVEQALNKGYVGQASLTSLITEINHQPGFEAYKLDEPTALQFLQEHFAPRPANQRDAAFWHLAAPHDLQPIA